VQKEAGNKKEVDLLYAEAAVEVIALVEAGDEAGVHTYFCEGQDATTDSGVWKRSLQGMRDTLLANNPKYKVVTARHFRPTHRTGNNQRFTVVLLSDWQKQQKDASDAEAEKVKQIEKDAADAKRAAELAEDMSTTEGDILAVAASEIDRLGLSAVIFARLVVGSLTPDQYSSLLDWLKAADEASTSQTQTNAKRPQKRAA
jgi:hypothetical protein